MTSSGVEALIWRAGRVGTGWINGLRPVGQGSRRPGAGSCPWVTITLCSAKLPYGKEPPIIHCNCCLPSIFLLLLCISSGRWCPLPCPLQQCINFPSDQLVNVPAGNCWPSITTEKVWAYSWDCKGSPGLGSNLYWIWCSIKNTFLKMKKVTFQI